MEENPASSSQARNQTKIIIRHECLTHTNSPLYQINLVCNPKDIRTPMGGEKDHCRILQHMTSKDDVLFLIITTSQLVQ
jgi:hypothetical protein